MKRPMTTARRIRQRRKALTLTQAELGKLVGVGQSAVTAWEGGRNIPKGETAARLAEALGVSRDWLLYGDESGQPKKQVRLRGYVGAGAEVFMLPDELVDWVAAPPDEDTETEAFEIRGNTQWPVYRHGDLIYFEKDRTADPADCVGEECIVELDDGKLYLKRILPGTRPGVYTLASYNAPEEPDRMIVSCGPVLWVKRRRAQR